MSNSTIRIKSGIRCSNDVHFHVYSFVFHKTLQHSNVPRKDYKGAGHVYVDRIESTFRTINATLSIEAFPLDFRVR